MKSKPLFLFIILSLTLISCDSNLLIKVSLGEEISNQDISLVDYNFTTASSENSESLFFEFITNKELTDSTVVVFLDRAGNTLAAKQTGLQKNLIETPAEIIGEKSFFYTIKIKNLRSQSLIKEVVIGK